MTTHELVLMTVTWVEELLEEEELAVEPVAPPPVEPLPVPEPNPDPEPEPELEPDPDPELELEDPLICWPTLKFTEATTPAIGDVRLASVREACAESTWPCAAVAAAVSAASWVLDAAESAVTLACAEARLACA